MSIRVLSLAALALAPLVAGCVETAPPAAPPQPAVSYDGTYRGLIRITGMATAVVQSGWCDTNTNLAWTVRGNSFTYVMQHPKMPGTTLPLTFTGAIAPDGTINLLTVNGEASMTGVATPTQITGTISGSFCAYSFSLSRS